MITKAKALETAMGELKKTEAVSFDKAVEGIRHGAETATVGLEHVQVQAKAGLEQAQVQVKDGMQKALKTAEQVTQFSQGNLEAVMKSSQILATGLTDMSKLVAESARANLDETMSAFKAMTSVKSLKEAFELQTSFARTRLEKAMNESGKLTEHSLKLAEQAFAPITARVNAAVETFS